MNQLKRSLLSLFVFLAVGGGVVAYSYWGVFQKQEKEKVNKEKAEKLFDLDKAKVKTVKVFAKGQTTEISKEGEAWKLTSPVKVDADKSAVDALVERVASVKSKSVVLEQAGDLTPFGLANPRTRVSIAMEGASELTLSIGDENSFDGSLYAQVGGSPKVVLVEGGAKSALEKDTYDLRDKRLLPFEDRDVKKVEIKAPGLSYSLERSEGKWRLLSPEAGLADDATVNRVLSGLRNLRVNKFAEEQAKSLAPYGLEKPKAQVTLTVGEANAKLTLSLGLVEKEGRKTAYAKRGESSYVAEVGDSVLGDLDRPLFELKDKLILSFERDKVTGMKIAVGKDTFVLERKKEKAPDASLEQESWTIVQPKAAKAKTWKLNALMYSLQTLKATAFAEESPKDLKRYGLDRPSKTVTLLGENGADLISLSVGADVPKSPLSSFVKSSSSKRIFELEKSKLNELPLSLADMEEPSAAPAAAAQSASNPG